MLHRMKYFFMSGKEIRDRGNLKTLGGYITLTGQNYVLRKWEVAKSAMKWRVPEQTTSKSNMFAFAAKRTSPISTQGTKGLFVFGTETQTLEVPETFKLFKNSDDKRASSKLCKKKHPRPKPRKKS